MVCRPGKLTSTMRACFIFFVMLGCSFSSLLQAQSPASSKIFQTGRNSDGKPAVTIRLKASDDNEDTLTNEYVFASEKGFLGPSSNPTDQSGFANKENTVFGVSYEPVTKACFVKLFLLNASGTLVLVNNVNTRAAKLLRAPWAERVREFLRIEKIVGRHVYLQTTDFSTGARPTHNFSVLVAPDGTLTLREAAGTPSPSASGVLQQPRFRAEHIAAWAQKAPNGSRGTR
jgi:hypothetical protein